MAGRDDEQMVESIERGTSGPGCRCRDAERREIREFDHRATIEMQCRDAGLFALTVFRQTLIITPLERGSGGERGSHPNRILLGEAE